jgi:hypothetical protein
MSNTSVFTATNYPDSFNTLSPDERAKVQRHRIFQSVQPIPDMPVPPPDPIARAELKAQWANRQRDFADANRRAKKAFMAKRYPVKKGHQC